MSHVVDDALKLWEQPPAPDEGQAFAAFRRVYSDPVVINGVDTSTAQLVARARATHAALADLDFEILDRFGAGDRYAIAFRQSARHVGRMPGPNAAAPSGRIVTGMGMDIFTIGDGRIARIWVVSDLLARLTAPGDPPDSA